MEAALIIPNCRTHTNEHPFGRLRAGRAQERPFDPAPLGSARDRQGWLPREQEGSEGIFGKARGKVQLVKLTFWPTSQQEMRPRTFCGKDQMQACVLRY